MFYFLLSDRIKTISEKRKSIRLFREEEKHHSERSYLNFENIREYYVFCWILTKYICDSTHK